MPRISLAAALAAGLLVAGQNLNAASSTWNGTASVNWTNAPSWLSGTLPIQGDDVIIADTTVNNSLTLNDGPHTIGVLQYGTTGTRTAVFTINGNVTTAAAHPLTITNGIVANGALATSGGNLITKLPIIVQGDQTWSVGGSVPAVGNDYGLLLTVGANGTQRPLTLNGILTKTGPGQLCFIGQNVGNGDIVVNQGWLKLNAGSSTTNTVGGTGSITVNNGGVLMIAKNSGTLNITKAIVLNDGATFRLGGNSATLNAVGSSVTFNGTVPIVVSYTSLLLDFPNAWSGTLNSTITGDGGTITLWANNAALAGTLNNSGIFKVRFGSANAGSPGVQWALNNAAAYYEIYGPATSVQLGALSGTAGTVRNSNTNNAAATVTIGALNTDTTFGGALADNTAALGLTKVGSGTLTLTGANTLSGNIAVNNGSLLVQGAGASAGSGVITVFPGTTFGGSGSALGSVNIQAGGKVVATGGSGAPALTVGSLTFGSGGSDATTTDISLWLGGKIVANSGLTVNGTCTINIVGAALAVGTYDLIQHPGSIGGAGFPGFSLGTLPYGVVAHLQNGATAVQLVVDSITAEPSVWAGNASSTWNLTGSLDWKGATSGTPQSYHDFDVTSFDDSAANFTVDVVTNVTPASMTVSAASHDYTFTGTGSVMGPGALAKSGAGTLIIANSNTFSGGTLIAGGTLQLGNGGASGSLAGPITNKASLTFNRSDALAVANLVSDVGGVEQKGLGVTTLSGANTYEGPTTITSGTLAAGNGAAFGNTNVGVTVASGATLDVNAQALGMEPISAIGAGVGGAGAIVNNGTADSQNGTRYVTLTGDTVFGGMRRWDIRNPSAATDTTGGTHAFLHGGGFRLTKVSTNVVAFIQVGDTALGNIDLQGGTLTFSRSTQPGNPSSVLAVWPGATLQFHRLSEYIVNPFNKVITMTNATVAVEGSGLTNEVTGPVTLTGSNVVATPASTGLILRGPLSGPGSLNHLGPNLLVIAGSASHTGGTTVSGSILQVDGNLGGGLSGITSSTLAGTGTISGAVTVPAGCTLAPGNDDPSAAGIGALGVGSLALQPGSTNRFDVNTDASINDRVNASSTVVYGGTLVISNLGFTAYAPGNSFKLFNGTSYSGKFASLVPAAPALGLLWDTNTLATDGTLRIILQPTPRPLAVLSVSSLLSNSVNVVFDTEVDQVTASDPANYTFSTGHHVLYGTAFSPTNMQLFLDAPLTAPTYSVQVKNVKDLAYIPNVVVTTNVPGRSWSFWDSKSIQITNGSAFAFGDKIKIYSDGVDIFGTSDQFQYVYKEVTGDFDVSVCLESFRITDPAAKAGIMARQINDLTMVLPGDRHFLSGAFTADPARNNNFVEYREDTDGITTAPGAPRPGATYPTNWVRLKRTGSVMQGFSGPNGLDWSPMTAVDSATNTAGAYPATVRLGLAVTSHNIAQTTEAVFHTFGAAKERPVFTITRSGDNVILSWSAGGLGWALQASPSLAPPDVNWTTVPGSTTTTTVTLPIGPGNQFFRLMQ